MKCPHLSHGHTDLLKKQNARRGGEGGGLAKVMGIEKQLRPVEKTRMGELKKLKHKSEGSLEQHKINLQSFKGSPSLSFQMFFLTLWNPSVKNYVADFLPNSARFIHW